MEHVSKEMRVFTEALALPPAERADYLDRACGDDAELRRKIEALLKAHDRVGSFMERPSTGLKEGRAGTNNHSSEE